MKFKPGDRVRVELSLLKKFDKVKLGTVVEWPKEKLKITSQNTIDKTTPIIFDDPGNWPTPAIIYTNHITLIQNEDISSMAFDEIWD